MLDNFAAGGAAINQLCSAYGLGFKVFDPRPRRADRDITEARRWTSAPASPPWPSAWRRWRRARIASASARMGIGNTTVAAALYAALLGGDPAHWVGRGTGVDDAGSRARSRRWRRRSPAMPGISTIRSNPAPPRRPRDRGHGGRHPRRAAAACAGGDRRLRLHRRRGGAPCARPVRPRPLRRGPCLGRGRPCRSAGKARPEARSSLAGCASARARAPPWRWGSSRARSPAIRAWRPSRRRVFRGRAWLIDHAQPRGTLAPSETTLR